MIRRPPRSTRTDTLFPYTTLFRSNEVSTLLVQRVGAGSKTNEFNISSKVSGGFYFIRLSADSDHITRKIRSEEHTSELQSLMRISYAVFCLKKKNTQKKLIISITQTTATIYDYINQ